MNQATDLLLFSGGIDSTVLLKHFLQERKKVRVLYIELGWAERMHGRVRLQNTAANSILQYMSKKYGDFEYSQATVMTTLNEENESTYFGTDNQWCVFYGAMFCNNYNIDRMWMGHYSFSDEILRQKYVKHENDTEVYGHHCLPGDYTKEKMQFYIDVGSRLQNSDIDFCTPATVYKGEGIDRFKNKKEAWDTLEIDLKKMVRSCLSTEWHCNDCPKCNNHRKMNIYDDKGMPL
jgi:7-cyano-7-deazaguanine synthase in queuosine biosynthesis